MVTAAPDLTFSRCDNGRGSVEGSSSFLTSEGLALWNLVIFMVEELCSRLVASPSTISMDINLPFDVENHCLSKEVWKLNFPQYGQMEKHSQEETRKWRKSEGRR